MRALSARGRKEGIRLEGCAQVSFACGLVARRKAASGEWRKSPRTVPFCPCHFFRLPLSSCISQTDPSPTSFPNLEPVCLFWKRRTEAYMGHLKSTFLHQPHLPSLA